MLHRALPLNPLRWKAGVLQQWHWHQDKLGWAFEKNVNNPDFGEWLDVPDDDKAGETKMTVEDSEGKQDR